MSESAPTTESTQEIDLTNELHPETGSDTGETHGALGRAGAGSSEDLALARAEKSVVIATEAMEVFYGSFRAIEPVTMDFQAREITALIGPSGCGKSTVLRCFNRMNDLIPGARVDGVVRYHGENIYDPLVDPVEVRRRVGMVFQKPNPFPKSIYDNVAWGAKINGEAGSKAEMDDLVQGALEAAALWEEVKGKLHDSGHSLSGGQQQRLCIARAIATSPDVLLMDEPASALDPIATLRIEELMLELKKQYSIIIVTHNMQQAARVSDKTAFFNVKLSDEGVRSGRLVEYSDTDQLFTSPAEGETEDYITGRFG